MHRIFVSARNPIRLAVASALMLASSQSLASGFALLEQSASRLGTAFSGTAAAADDATTLFYNAAGMLKLDQAQIGVVASGIGISSRFDDEGSLPALGQTLGTEGGDAGSFQGVPALYVVVPFNEDIAAGFAFNVPFGLTLEYDDDWIGRFQALKSEIKTYNFNPSLAFRLNDHVSLGFGLSYQRMQAELTNAVNYTAAIAAVSPALVPLNPGLQGGLVVRGDDSAWGFNAGVLLEFTPRTRLGLSYRSSIAYEVDGTVNFSPPTPTNPAGAAIVAAASAPGGALSDGGATVGIELPDIATASFYQAIGDRAELLVDVAWTGWSSVQYLDVVRDNGVVLSSTPELWEDTWRYAIGMTWKLNDAWKLRGGLAYDETQVPDATRTARLPDTDRKWVAIGAHWEPSSSWLIDVGYAHLFSSDTPIEQNDGSTARSGLLLGQQESAVDIVSAQLSFRF
ncbi:MAG TPA: outer membrane protein transport protein [Povalibacter sp.]|uniref:OmpP1/FadL family transporter n=1 Tax=Povalibacter sp. TaxID=1962978 RepID=UPI002C7FD8F1|nr:outer membrane protein transport protein [Povalibacter sp.]HMN45091.1 outer membrane protein transport protein [Povalibacter sp.]